MTDRWFIGLGLALLVEAANWTKLRWEFNEEAYIRAWQMTAIAIFIASTLVYLDSNIYVALPRLLTWLPPLMMPMQFVQSFGMSESVPLNTFSFLAKQRRKRNLRWGLTERVVRVNFGNIYFVTILVGSTLGSRTTGSASWAFLPGIIVLTGWMLLSSTRSRPLSLVIALSVAGCISIAGQLGLQRFDDYFLKSSVGPQLFNPNSVSTRIGHLGTLTLPTEMIWRIRTEGKSPVPKLLRNAGYNVYQNGNWETRPPKSKSFDELASRIYEGLPYFLVTPGLDEKQQLRAVRKTLPRFKLRGAAEEKGPIPLPGDATSLLNFELDGMERNLFGTVRGSTKQAVIEGTVLWRGDTNTEDPPVRPEDLWFSKREEKALDRILAELQLDRQPTLDGKLSVLERWFQSNFKYSRELKIQAPPRTEPELPTAIAQFLETERVGHCEYFATATALLLRKSGIPTRYATGYAVSEYDAKHHEWVIRGTHGHAWCRVWDESKGSWRDFDTTPGSWFGTVAQLNPSTQWFNDTLKRLRENFFIWRTRPANRLGATLVMTAIGLGITTFVIRRLWRSKRRLDVNVWVTGYQGETIRTPLNTLEKPARHRLGTRPPGTPFGVWLGGLRKFILNPAALEEAIALHQKLRFDPVAHEKPQSERLRELTRELEIAIKRSKHLPGRGQ